VSFGPSILRAIKGVTWGSWRSGDELGGIAWMRDWEVWYAVRRGATLAKARETAVKASFMERARGAISYFSVRLQYQTVYTKEHLDVLTIIQRRSVESDACQVSP